MYWLISRHCIEALEKVNLKVDDTSKDKDVLILHITGTRSSIETLCEAINNSRTDLETRQCVTEANDKLTDKQFIINLEDKYKCCIQVEDSEMALPADDNDDIEISDHDKKKLKMQVTICQNKCTGLELQGNNNYCN